MIHDLLFVPKYRLYLPTGEEFQLEILRERELIERRIKENGIGKECGEATIFFWTLLDTCQFSKFA